MNLDRLGKATSAPVKGVLGVGFLEKWVVHIDFNKVEFPCRGYSVKI